jgi:hypothetical protein
MAIWNVGSGKLDLKLVLIHFYITRIAPFQHFNIPIGVMG